MIDLEWLKWLVPFVGMTLIAYFLMPECQTSCTGCFGSMDLISDILSLFPLVGLLATVIGLAKYTKLKKETAE